MSKEYRGQQRKQPINYLEVYNRESCQFMGRILDITTGGMRLFGEVPFEENNTYEMKLTFPQPIKKIEEVSFDAKCVWCVEYTHSFFRGSHSAGFKLTNLSTADRELLESLINSPWFRDWRLLPDYEAIRRETDYPVE